MMQVDRGAGPQPATGSPDKGWSLGSPDKGWSLGSPDKGWSLNFLKTRAGPVLGAALVAATALAPTATLATYDPAADIYSMHRMTSISGARAWWNAGYTGRGVDIALIDSGVAPVEGLSAPGKVVNGPDLSLEGQNPEFRYLDTAGHGTFMAGLIAGRDSSVTGSYASAPASAYLGMAPDARIVSLKVATADGGTDVTQIIAAINWVVQHKNDNGLNIRIINLSYGTNSRQAYGVDPLSYAVEQAWKKGIVVVAAAGNTGYQRGNNAPGLANPAYNPFILGVGGYDPGPGDGIGDDSIGSYSASSAGCGSKCKNPDMVAIGSHMQGLRVVNSLVDLTHPEGRIDTRYFRGSGTSQAAAITSGALALILQKYPTLSPDSLKKFVVSNSKKIGGADTQAQGAGEMNLTGMLTKAPSNFTQGFTAAKGTGSLELSRGTDRITRDNVAISGEVDIMGQTYDSAAMAAATAAGSSWSGGDWNGSSWSGSSWSGSSWSGSSWSGSSWSGSSWSGSSWSGSSWSSNTWSGSSWSGSSWSGSSWSGASWTGASWATGSWN